MKKMKTMEINGKEYPIKGYAEDGLPIIQAIATTTEDGVDKDGNKKISVKINVPVADLLGTPGKVG